MADIDIRQPHSYSKDDAKKRVEIMLNKMAERMKVKAEWSGDAAKLSGPAKGTVTVSDADVHVEIKLPLAMKMMKGMVNEQVQKGLNKALG